MALRSGQARGAFVVFLAQILFGCAALPSALSPPPVTREALLAEYVFEQEAALDRLRAQESRLAAVVFRLAAGAVGLCPKTGPATGMVLHHIDQYGAETRPYARTWFRMDESPAVLALVPGSPADLAGLRVGDALVSVNGYRFEPSPGPMPSSASYAAMEKARRLLDRELAAGPATLSIRRSGADLALQLSAQRHCVSDVQLEVSSQVNASADKERLFITTAMVRYAGTDDELAIFVAHELAHIFLGHQDRIALSGPGGALLGNLGSAGQGLRNLEAEADYLGLYLVARADYDIGAAEPLWRQFGADFPVIRRQHRTHPGSHARIVAMRKTAAEITGKRASGVPISPEQVGLPTSASPSGRP
jgi:Zn-dependent protease with chaperone function